MNRTERAALMWTELLVHTQTHARTPCQIGLVTMQQILWTHMKLWWLEAEVSEGVTELLLRLHHLGQLSGHGLSQPDHILVLSLVVTQDFDLGLQLQVDGSRASAQLLWENLPGALQQTDSQHWSDTLTTYINDCGTFVLTKYKFKKEQDTIGNVSLTYKSIHSLFFKH